MQTSGNQHSPRAEPSWVERGGEWRSDPTPSLLPPRQDRSGGSGFPEAQGPWPQQPRRKQHGRRPDGKSQKTATPAQAGNKQQRPHARPRLPLPRRVPRGRPHAWQTSFLLSEPLVLPADDPQLQGPCPFPPFISPDHRGTGHPGRVEAQHPTPSTCVILQTLGGTEPRGHYCQDTVATTTHIPAE